VLPLVCTFLLPSAAPELHFAEGRPHRAMDSSSGARHVRSPSSPARSSPSPAIVSSPGASRRPQSPTRGSPHSDESDPTWYWRNPARREERAAARQARVAASRRVRQRPYRRPSRQRGVRLRISCGHLALIPGNTFSIMNSLMTSLVMELMGFTSIVPAGRLTLVLLARSNVTKGKHPIFPSKVQTPFSNHGREVAHKNMSLGMLFLLLQVR
jgi:hypothetical protein